ncbi:MAG TPA: diguanylate cyclase [Xanthobacteraceae bacterium]|nr:diguanylate cyclase [Xanthobacteraceae bacterium]
MTARVLVVDDVAANVKLLEARLSAEYFDVITAMSGEQALAICERAECDLVLLDVMMPDLDGFEFVVVMPETDMAVAAMVAERLRRRIAAEPFAIHEGARSIPVTISIGIAALRGADDNAAGVLKRADQALYRAKRDGRNRVVPDAA